MKKWLEYFKYNGGHRQEIPWQDHISIAPSMRAPLIHSLQRFQVGESGEGRHLRGQTRCTNDPEYMAAIDLFIKEEQEHARLMAKILQNGGNAATASLE